MHNAELKKHSLFFAILSYYSIFSCFIPLLFTDEFRPSFYLDVFEEAEYRKIIKLIILRHSVFLHHPHASQHIQPPCQREGAEQCGEHNHAGSKHAFMSHILRHDKAANRSS